MSVVPEMWLVLGLRGVKKIVSFCLKMFDSFAHTFNFHCKLIFDNERYMQTPQEVQRVQAQTRREFVLRTQQSAWQRR